MKQPRVLAALSGGVDSAVAALLLKQQGYDVVGVFLRHGVEAPVAECDPNAKQACCSPEDARDAARVADILGIPFHSVDMQQEFDSIQTYFRAEYEIGRTPNPCVVCNRDIKFGALAQFADVIGAQFLATGHYAQTAPGGQLLRGVDPKKDQSYVLFPVGRQVLERTLLPIGGINKIETRRLAKEAGLPIHAKPDSVEICFVPSNDYRDLLRQTGGLGKPGRILTLDGQVVAVHDGFMGFTRGQRKGLGFAWTEPMYVVDVHPQTGDVIVGPASSRGCVRCLVHDWISYDDQDFCPGDVYDPIEIQYRSSPGGVMGLARCTEPGCVEIVFQSPADSVTPGQGLAVYRGERLIGGGWIAEAPPQPQLTV
jgi:tRNA-specific 2-thiouridylase